MCDSRCGCGPINTEVMSYDENRKELKPRVDLVPPEAVLAIAQILSFGAEKHGEREWEKGKSWSDHYAACQRHLLKWFSGEQVDDETGKSHLHHAATRLLFLISYEINCIGVDDRPLYHKAKRETPSFTT